VTAIDLDGPASGAIVRTQNIFRLLTRIGDVRLLFVDESGVNNRPPRTSMGGFQLAGSVKLLGPQSPTIIERVRNELDPSFLKTNGVEAAPESRAFVRELAAAHDVLWIHNLRVANEIGILKWTGSVLDIDDVPSSIIESQLPLSRGATAKLRLLRQLLLWRRRESRLLARFSAICVCSDADRKRLGGGDRIVVIRNGFVLDSQQKVRQPSIPHRLGLLGNFGHPPNLDGVTWFLNEVWDRILGEAPSTRLRLAGGNLPTTLLPAASNVDALGWVPSVGDEVATWSLGIVPIRFGAGTRVKLAELFGRRCPVVSTPIGAFGYEVVDGEHLLIRERAEDFASACLEMLQSPNAALALADRAHDAYLKNWTWEAQSAAVERAVEAALGSRRAGLSVD